MPLAEALAVSIAVGPVKTTLKLALGDGAPTDIDAVWLKVEGQDRFYIRSGNTSRELSPPEAARYISRHR